MADLAHRAPRFAVPDHTIGLVDIRRGKKGRSVPHAQFEDLDGFFDSLQSKVPVAFEACALGGVAGKRLARRSRQQRLSAASQAHHARGERNRKAFDFRIHCAMRDVLGRILAKRDRAHMNAHPRLERKAGQFPVVVERVAGRVDRILEPGEDAVGATDLAAVMTCDKVTCLPVVRGPDLRRAGVAQALAQTSAVHDVRVENGKDGHDRFVQFVAATAGEAVARCKYRRSFGSIAREGLGHAAAHPAPPRHSGRRCAGAVRWRVADWMRAARSLLPARMQ